jgi:type VI secretion system protein ImpC
VAPHLVPETRPADPAGVVEFDASITSALRSLLHHQDFQALEANWRAVDLLVRRLETDSSLRISVVDVSKAELAADLDGNRALEDTGAFRLLVDASVGTPGAAPWALLVGLYTFGSDPADVALLARLASLAHQAGAPWLAAAHSSLVGSPSFGTVPDADDWRVGATPEFDALRRSADARFVGLALPRFLLRLPYGADGEPCELSRFEELAQPAAHDDYLWGNSAVLVGLLHAEAFTTDGWALRPRLDVSRLPLHLVRADGEVTAKPCAEIVLTERATLRTLDRGPMPVQSLKNGDSVRVARHQSIAEPLAALAGRWRPVHDADS